ncbi:MFS transporter [Falsirhodobacter sp. 20TX0035]|uniref:MFS transporter n=1 Tax=Falsirhodobacter sp. 20TX0035 TaxID=3022019 RepID=UPI00232DCFCD|nr:MFS transporter [Falsirhodobacter sp. 20TX0035]MDB6454971.1 MFS transporter [Falsirhodobacter sp. 20TX0035]
MTDPSRPLSRGLVFLFAAACGLIVANLYYPQPLAGPIARDLGLSPGAAGLTVTLTQVGYGLGLLFLVPLGDLMENRRLILALMAGLTVALVVAGLAGSAALFLTAGLAVGLGAVAVQVLVPFAAALADEATRGRTVGNVMSGLLLGIMLARPVSGLIADVAGWHMVYALSAGAMVMLGVALRLRLPKRMPQGGMSYGSLLHSMMGLVRDTPVLRRRALYHAALFSVFSLFWTVTPLLLAERYGLDQRGIALFALAGVAGALIAPAAGRWADAGHTRVATLAALLLAIAAFALSLVPGLIVLTVAAIVLDAAIGMNLVLSQREIFALGAATRNRLNGLFMAAFFVGGAVGSGFGALAYEQGGWLAAALIGMAAPALALAAFLVLERRA